MSKLKNSFDYNFEGELLYKKSKESDLVPAKKISIKAPTNSNIVETIILEQEYERSPFKIASSFKDFIGQTQMDKMMEEGTKNKTKSKEKKEEEPTKESVVKQLMGGADVEKCFDVLRKILLSTHRNNPIAMIDDIEPLTDTIYEDILVKDIKNILGLYILNFIVTSPVP